ncbi:Bug family tripartite tricarboxylate transporter substrate binding protein [Cupriavidus basilensis]|uniref:Bug family tripartite tricarboxylate transporter substrate binding protein n=1 Tax=Cupriavidus basilensis TaxID=68895 RepID=UPI0023E85583|nr:tripartite tricarboxylate transporter substrate binding protein [Cupriavidus basilensis]MDF3882316.1 tripartite tricarboxylate transporter substrate binding protein [Cupriavidus basilensis]
MRFTTSLLRWVAPAALAFSSLCVTATGYPDKPVKLVVPFPAGGPTDALARLIGQHLSQQLGQPFVVDNRGGAGGTIATEAAASAAPDGYTLFFSTTGTMAINPSLYKTLKVDPAKAFDSVGAVASTVNVLVVAPLLAAANVKDLIALARQKPGTLTFGSAGNGSSNHLSGELFKSMAAIDIVHVPYKGSSAAFTDLLGGRISMMFDTVSSQVQYLSAGKVKALGVTGTTRSEALPKVPTVAESGLPGFEVTIWFGLSAPKGTPPDVITRLNGELQKVLAQADVKAQLAALGAKPLPGTPKEFSQLIQRDAAKWSAVVKASGASLD